MLKDNELQTMQM